MKFVGYVSLTIAAIVSRGFVLKLMWQWFIVHQFHVPTITIPVALGISALVSMLCKDSGNKAGKYSEVLIQGLIEPWVILFFAWIYTWWM